VKTQTLSAYQHFDTVIHSGIVSAYKSVTIKLWYLLRSFDQAGTGKVSFLVEEAMMALNLSKRQVERYIAKLLKDSFFRKVSQQGNKCTVYLASAEKVALALDCDFGTCFWLNADMLPELRKNVVNATFQAIQRQADYKVRRALFSGEIEACLSHEYLMKAYASDAADTSRQNQPLKYGQGVIGYVEKNQTLLVADHVKIGFASSASVATATGLCLRTLYNHMKDVPKLRIGLWRKENPQLREAARLSGHASYKRFVNFKRATKGDLVIEMSGFVVTDEAYVFASKAFQKKALKGKDRSTVKLGLQ
jgi:hypothetical protein